MGFAVSIASSACFARGGRCFSANAATVSWPRQPQASAGGAAVSESADSVRKVRAETVRLIQDSSRMPPPPGVPQNRPGYPHPRYFVKRGCKRLKTKETSAEKSAKRDERGGKSMKRMDLPPRHRARSGKNS